MTRKELLIKAMNFEEVPRVPVSTLSGATWAIKQEGISPGGAASPAGCGSADYSGYL